MDEYVTIKTYVFPHELYIDRSKLESHGIECYVRDELTIQIHNFYSHALGGIRLQVRKKNVQIAEEILRHNLDLESDYEDSIIKCPNCKSGERFKNKTQ